MAELSLLCRVGVDTSAGECADAELEARNTKPARGRISADCIISESPRRELRSGVWIDSSSLFADGAIVAA